MSDYLPEVSAADVDRIIERDFAPALRQRARDLLVAHVSASWANSPHRVQLAALKMAGGDVAALEAQLKLAMDDFRDVIAPAEYPRFWEVGFVGVEELSAAEREQLKHDDHQQYLRWLKR